MSIALVCALIAVTALLLVTAFLLTRQIRQVRNEAYHSWTVAQDFCQLTGYCARLLDRIRIIYACDPDALAKAISTLSKVEQAHIKQDKASTIGVYLEKIESTMSEHSTFIGQSREYAKRPKPGEAGIGTFR